MVVSKQVKCPMNHQVRGMAFQRYSFVCGLRDADAASKNDIAEQYARGGAQQQPVIWAIRRPMPAELIYTTYRLSLYYPPDRTVFGVIVRFFQGA